MKNILLKINIIFILLIYFINKTENFSTFKDLDDELVDIQTYVDFIFNGTLIDRNKKFFLTDNPKITVIISVFNGEAYIQTALLSIQNQDFKDLEILLIDDGSTDNSVNLIKKLMTNEPRIVLYQNNKNRGTLYSKTKGILLAKGKYILICDEDDIFIQKEAFSILYKQAEKNNLDILGFKMIKSTIKLENIKFKRINKEFPIIFQPKLSEEMFMHSSDGGIMKKEGYLTNHFIKKDILIKVIKQLDENFLNVKMTFHEDYILYFLLTRNAYNFQKIDRIFYMVIQGWNITNQKIAFRIKEKTRNYEYLRCSSLLYFIEFILKYTKNTRYDKEIAFYSFDKWFLSYWCRNYSATFKRAMNISYLYLENKYIHEKDKEKIKKFLNELKFANY